MYWQRRQRRPQASDVMPSPDGIFLCKRIKLDGDSSGIVNGGLKQIMLSRFFLVSVHCWLTENFEGGSEDDSPIPCRAEVDHASMGFDSFIRRLVKFGAVRCGNLYLNSSLSSSRVKKMRASVYLMYAGHGSNVTQFSVVLTGAVVILNHLLVNHKDNQANISHRISV